jgi:hypothetical protein
MEQKISAHKVGLVVGFVISGLHVLWTILVAVGLAQMLVDFVLWAHMVHLSVVIGPFDVGTALTLIVVTFIVGYAVGRLVGTVWNRVHATHA